MSNALIHNRSLDSICTNVSFYALIISIIKMTKADCFTYKCTSEDGAIALLYGWGTRPPSFTSLKSKSECITFCYSQRTGGKNHSIFKKKYVFYSQKSFGYHPTGQLLACINCCIYKDSSERVKCNSSSSFVFLPF